MKLPSVKTVTEFLREVKANNEKLEKESFPFNEREKAKAELVRSLLKKVDSGKLRAEGELNKH